MTSGSKDVTATYNRRSNLKPDHKTLTALYASFITPDSIDKKWGQNN
jgi:hypothetical protein